MRHLRSRRPSLFVEIWSVGAVPLDLGGVVLRDGAGVRHTFPPDTVLPAYGRLVVFAGGTPTGTFGGAIVQVANGTAAGGGLGLNNTGDTVTLALPNGTVIDTVTYGSEANANESIVWTAGGWVRHGTRPRSIGAYSPGVTEDGFAL